MDASPILVLEVIRYQNNIINIDASLSAIAKNNPDRSVSELVVALAQHILNPENKVVQGPRDFSELVKLEKMLVQSKSSETAEKIYHLGINLLSSGSKTDDAFTKLIASLNTFANAFQVAMYKICSGIGWYRETYQKQIESASQKQLLALEYLNLLSPRDRQDQELIEACLKLASKGGRAVYSHLSLIESFDMRRETIKALLKVQDSNDFPREGSCFVVASRLLSVPGKSDVTFQKLLQKRNRLQKELNDTTQDRNEKINALKDQIQEKSLDHTHTPSVGLAIEINDLKTNLASYEKSVKEIEEQIKSLTEELSQQYLVQKEANKEIIRLESEIKDSQNKIKDQNETLSENSKAFWQEIARLNAKSSDDEKNLKMQSQEIEKLKHQVDNYGKTELKPQLDQLIKSRALLFQEIKATAESIREKRKALAEDTKTTNQELTQLREQLKTKEDELDSLIAGQEEVPAKLANINAIKGLSDQLMKVDSRILKNLIPVLFSLGPFTEADLPKIEAILKPLGSLRFDVLINGWGQIIAPMIRMVQEDPSCTLEDIKKIVLSYQKVLVNPTANKFSSVAFENFAPCVERNVQHYINSFPRSPGAIREGSISQLTKALYDIYAGCKEYRLTGYGGNPINKSDWAMLDSHIMGMKMDASTPTILAAAAQNITAIDTSENKVDKIQAFKLITDWRLDQQQSDIVLRILHDLSQDQQMTILETINRMKGQAKNHNHNDFILLLDKLIAHDAFPARVVEIVQKAAAIDMKNISYDDLSKTIDLILVGIDNAEICTKIITTVLDYLEKGSLNDLRTIAPIVAQIANGKERAASLDDLLNKRNSQAIYVQANGIVDVERKKYQSLVDQFLNGDKGLDETISNYASTMDVDISKATIAFSKDVLLKLNDESFSQQVQNKVTSGNMEIVLLLADLQRKASVSEPNIGRDIYLKALGFLLPKELMKDNRIIMENNRLNTPLSRYISIQSLTKLTNTERTNLDDVSSYLGFARNPSAERVQAIVDEYKLKSLSNYVRYAFRFNGLSDAQLKNVLIAADLLPDHSSPEAIEGLAKTLEGVKEEDSKTFLIRIISQMTAFKGTEKEISTIKDIGQILDDSENDVDRISVYSYIMGINSQSRTSEGIIRGLGTYKILLQNKDVRVSAALLGGEMAASSPRATSLIGSLNPAIQQQALDALKLVVNAPIQVQENLVSLFQGFSLPATHAEPLLNRIIVIPEEERNSIIQIAAQCITPEIKIDDRIRIIESIEKIQNKVKDQDNLGMVPLILANLNAEEIGEIEALIVNDQVSNKEDLIRNVGIVLSKSKVGFSFAGKKRLIELMKLIKPIPETFNQDLSIFLNEISANKEEALSKLSAIPPTQIAGFVQRVVELVQTMDSSQKSRFAQALWRLSETTKLKIENSAEAASQLSLLNGTQLEIALQQVQWLSTRVTEDNLSQIITSFLRISEFNDRDTTVKLLKILNDEKFSVATFSAIIPIAKKGPNILTRFATFQDGSCTLQQITELAKIKQKKMTVILGPVDLSIPTSAEEASPKILTQDEMINDCIDLILKSKKYAKAEGDVLSESQVVTQMKLKLFSEISRILNRINTLEKKAQAIEGIKLLILSEEGGKNLAEAAELFINMSDVTRKNVLNVVTKIPAESRTLDDIKHAEELFSQINKDLGSDLYENWNEIQIRKFLEMPSLFIPIIGEEEGKLRLEILRAFEDGDTENRTRSQSAQDRIRPQLAQCSLSELNEINRKINLIRSTDTSIDNRGIQMTLREAALNSKLDEFNQENAVRKEQVLTSILTITKKDPSLLDPLFSMLITLPLKEKSELLKLISSSQQPQTIVNALNSKLNELIGVTEKLNLVRAFLLMPEEPMDTIAAFALQLDIINSENSLTLALEALHLMKANPKNAPADIVAALAIMLREYIPANDSKFLCLLNCFKGFKSEKLVSDTLLDLSKKIATVFSLIDKSPKIQAEITKDLGEMDDHFDRINFINCAYDYIREVNKEDAGSWFYTTQDQTKICRLRAIRLLYHDNTKQGHDTYISNCESLTDTLMERQEYATADELDFIFQLAEWIPQEKRTLDTIMGVLRMGFALGKDRDRILDALKKLKNPDVAVLRIIKDHHHPTFFECTSIIHQYTNK